MTKVVRLGLKWWWVLALAVVCAFPSGTHSAAGVVSQQSPAPAASETPDKPAVPDKAASPENTTGDQSAPAKTSAHKSARPKSPAPATASKTPARKTTSAQTRSLAAKKRKRPLSPRVRRMREAFVASTSLRPMAQQLTQDRSPAAYAGVEAYARTHAKEDAGALAWLVVGYARVLDHDYAKAIDPLNRAKPRAGDLGDYVA